MTHLLELVEKNNIKEIKKFIEEGGDLNIQDKWGDTALLCAIYKRHLDIAVLLLDNGADKDLKNHNGKTALDYAEKYNYTEIIELLTMSLENRLKEKELRKKEKELKEKFERKERTIKEELIKEFEERKKMMTEGLIKKFEEKEKELTKILEEKEGKLLAGFQTKFNGLQYRNLNDLQSAKFISDYEKRIICGLLPMPIAKINN
jgi:ankyrin repeat protein